MIILKKIQLNNFLSHENTTIDLKEDEKLLIDGKSGSGKSSIVDAIIWGLYGEARVDNKSLVRRGAKSASVTLKLNDGANDYVITRSTNDKSKNSLAVTVSENGSPFVHIERTGLKDIQDWIEKEFLHASYELFINSVAYPQDNIDNFVRQTASKREDLLLEIINVINFDEMYVKAREGVSDRQALLAGAVSSRTFLINSKSGLVISASQIPVLEGELQKVDNMLTLIEQKNEIKKSISEKISAYNVEMSMFSNSISGLSKNISEKKSVFDSNKIKIEAQSAVNKDQLVKDAALVKEYKDRMSLLRYRIDRETEKAHKRMSHMANRPVVADYSGDIDRLNKQLIPLISDSNRCPSGDSCPFVIPIKRQIEFLESEINKKEKAALDSKEALVKWSENIKNYPEPEDVSACFPEIKALTEQLVKLEKSERDLADFEKNESVCKMLIEQNDRITSEIRKDEEVIKSLKDSVEAIKGNITLLNTDISNVDFDIRLIGLPLEIKSRRDRFASELAVARSSNDKIASVDQEIAKTEEEIKKLSDEVQKLELVKESLSPRGIKAVLIDYLIPMLEDKVNEILSQLSDFKIKFETQRGTSDGEGVVEGLFIQIFNEQGVLHDFDAYSGGEKLKIIVAISEALASMQKVGFRLLDELFIGLDEESTESFAKVMDKLQGRFKQVFCISHLRSIKDIFEKKLTVTKTHGVTKCE